MPRIENIRLTRVAIPLRQPFVTAAGKKTETHNIQVAVQLSDGTLGVAEASSSIAMPGETPAHMESALKQLAPEIREKDIRDYRSLIQDCWRLQPYHPTAVAALECALLDAYTRTQGQALYQFLGGSKISIESDLTLSIGTPAHLTKVTRAAVKKGFRKFRLELYGQRVVYKRLVILT